MIRLHDIDAEILLAWIQQGEAVPEPVRGVVATMADQLSHKSYASDALETISKILRNNGRNGVTGTSLAALKTAVLRPSEMVRLAAQPHVSCTSCGIALRSGEAASYNYDTGSFVCAACNTPSSLSCPKCQQCVFIDPDKLRRLATNACGCSGKKKAVPAEGQTGVPVGQLVNLDQPTWATIDNAAARPVGGVLIEDIHTNRGNNPFGVRTGPAPVEANAMPAATRHNMPNPRREPPHHQWTPPTVRAEVDPNMHMNEQDDVAWMIRRTGVVGQDPTPPAPDPMAIPAYRLDNDGGNT